MIKLIALAVVSTVVVLPAFAQQQPPQPSTRGMMRYDTNKDGYVDRVEWTTGQDARFKQLDANSDGKLVPEELLRTPPGARGALPNDAQSQRNSAFFQRMDTDRDGFVSKAEFMAQAEKNFARCDADKDGRITTEECRQALRRR